MNKTILLTAFLFSFISYTYSQTISDLINEVSQDTLVKNLREFSGEDPTVVNGSTVTITNRVSNLGNDIAADYVKQKLLSYGNIIVNDQVYSANGRNIVGTQLGITNPNDIYIICAHYDAVADYCADDNASGTIAILEVARILSKQCLDNTIVYALWDEEELGLIGSGYYANEAAINGDNILGVLNIDMMAYDGDDDEGFDIDVRDIANSIAMKDDIISVLNTYSFNLTENVVLPGTSASDHSQFWNNGYSAVLFGESWANNDETPYYHSSDDTFDRLDIPYYFEMTKLLLAYMATVTTLTDVDNTVAQTATSLTSNETLGSYQWLDCNNNNTPILNETNQTFIPLSNGVYAVEVTSGLCVEISDCIIFDTLSIEDISEENIAIYPNPIGSLLTIELPHFETANVSLLDIQGKIMFSQKITNMSHQVNLESLSTGSYFIQLIVNNKIYRRQLLKE